MEMPSPPCCKQPEHCVATMCGNLRAQPETQQTNLRRRPVLRRASAGDFRQASADERRRQLAGGGARRQRRPPEALQPRRGAIPAVRSALGGVLLQKLCRRLQHDETQCQSPESQVGLCDLETGGALAAVHPAVRGVLLQELCRRLRAESGIPRRCTDHFVHMLSILQAQLAQLA